MQPDGDARGDLLLRRLGLAVAIVAVGFAVATLVAHVVLTARGFEVRPPFAGDLVVGSLFPLAGALVLWRQPRNGAGWVLLSCALVAVSAFAHEWAYAGLVAGADLPVLTLALWLSAWTFVPYSAQPALLPLLFPHGRLPSPRWRWLLRLALVVLAVLTLVAMFSPNDEISDLGAPNPLGITLGRDGAVAPVVWPIAQAGSMLVLWLALAPVALVAMLGRLRSTTGAPRAQVQWLLLGIVGLLVLSVFSRLLAAPWDELVFAAAFACVPAALAIAVLRHGLLDVELVVNRTVVYGALTAVSVAAYLAVVALAGQVVHVGDYGPVIAGLVVVAAASVRGRIQRWVDRRLFGARNDPYAVVKLVTSATADVTEPSVALQRLSDVVREALRVPSTQVLDAAGDAVATSGSAVAGTHVVPAIDRGRQLGVLVVGRRTKNERLRPAEESALREIAHRAAALLSARRFIVELADSYARLVRAREEERRRIRRELHDGVGPALAGTALQLDSLALRLHDDRELGHRAEVLRDRLQETVGEVQRIVDGLRPGPLDALGLDAALHAFATSPDDATYVDVVTDLPRQLPAAVEVATYRIVGEAVANALRHAHATRASVLARLVADDVHIEVTDNGAGFGADVTSGCGLQSMHDRAQEMGGTVTIDSRRAAGTRVRAVIPVQQR